MYKKIIPIVTVCILLLGIAWFVGNLIEYNNSWKGLSPAVKDEWESTGEKEENPIAVFIKRGLGMGMPKGLEQFREPQTSIIKLQDAVRRMEKENSMMKAEIYDIRNEMEKRNEADSMAEEAR